MIKNVTDFFVCVLETLFPEYTRFSANISLSENLAMGVLFIGKPWSMKGVAIMIFFSTLIGPCQQGVLSWRGK